MNALSFKISRDVKFDRELDRAMVKVVIRYLCVLILSFFMVSIIMTSSLTLWLLIKNYFIDELIQFLDMVSAAIMIILPVRYFPFWFSGACMILNHIEKAIGIDVKDSSLVIFRNRGVKCSNMVVAYNYPIVLGFIYFNMFYRQLVSYDILPIFGSKLFCTIHMVMVTLMSVCMIFGKKIGVRNSERCAGSLVQSAQDSIWVDDWFFFVLMWFCALISVIREVKG